MANKKDEVLNKMRERVALSNSWTSTSRTYQKDDLKFFAGNSDNNYQWPSEVLANRRSGDDPRPCLTVNKLTQHVRQITNDLRMATPRVKVVPIDNGADVKTAQVLGGLIRQIEGTSEAVIAYLTACENQVIHGEGYVRLITDYESPETFNQVIRICAVNNPFNVYLDPNIKSPSGDDAEWGVIVESVSKEQFKRDWPDFDITSKVDTDSMWQSDDTVTVAEYFYKEYSEKVICLFNNGVTTEEGSPDYNQLLLQGFQIVRKRGTQFTTVRWLKTNGYEVLEESVWPGSKVPIVRVVGNEVVIDGRLEVSGIIRNAKDPQRTYNYNMSASIESLALQPKTPWVGYSGQFKSPAWKTANTRNHAYLEVDADVTDGQGAALPLPRRVEPPPVAQGIITAMNVAADDIKSATGQYNASLGMTSNERSGKAIMARQKEGDVGTYHYSDNLARAIRSIGRQLVELIPLVYDTNRMLRIVGEDGNSSVVQITPGQGNQFDQNGQILTFDPLVGSHDVEVITGPGYATQRIEALNMLGDLLQTNPQLMATVGDLFFGKMDFPGAQEIANRLKSMLPPDLADGQTQQSQQVQQLQTQIQELQSALQSVSQSIEMQKIEIQQFDAETRRIAALAKVQPELDIGKVQDVVMGTLDAMNS